MNNKNISKKQAEKVLATRDPYVGGLLKEINLTLRIMINRQKTIQRNWHNRLTDLEKSPA